MKSELVLIRDHIQHTDFDISELVFIWNLLLHSMLLISQNYTDFDIFFGINCYRDRIDAKIDGDYLWFDFFVPIILLISVPCNGKGRWSTTEYKFSSDRYIHSYQKHSVSAIYQ